MSLSKFKSSYFILPTFSPRLIYLGSISIIFSLSFAACSSLPSSQTTNSPKPSATTSSQNIISSEQIALHATPKSCWTVVNNNVYDISAFVPNHPGGKGIAKACGQDMTNFLNTQHKPGFEKALQPYLIGSLK